jgi:hypothetical protein
MLEIERVTKRFRGGVTAVNDLSLSLSGGGSACWARTARGRPPSCR